MIVDMIYNTSNLSKIFEYFVVPMRLFLEGLFLDKFPFEHLLLALGDIYQLNNYSYQNELLYIKILAAVLKIWALLPFLLFVDPKMLQVLRSG